MCSSGCCRIVPCWAERLGKLTARQDSPGGGTLYCRMEGGRVVLAGKAVLYAKSELFPGKNTAVS